MPLPPYNGAFRDLMHALLCTPQSNNAYVFPALGAAALLVRATALTEDAFLEVALILAAESDPAKAR